MIKVIRYAVIVMLLFLHDFVQGQSDIQMQNGRFRICKGNILDSEAGKNSGYYDHNENYTLTLSLPGATSIQLDFSSFCTEIDSDILSIFDGKDTNAKLLGRYSGSVNPGKIASTDSFITLHFISDQSVSCTGWKARVINNISTPKAATFSSNQKINCNDTVVRITLSNEVNCDSIHIGNTYINGNKINRIKPINCINSKSKSFDLFYTGIRANGTYQITHKHGYRDYCDSVYFLSSSLSFSVTNCPINLELLASSDTICLGDCIQLMTNATGGNASKYKYNWSVAGLSGASPQYCPQKTTMVILEVDDGNAIPGRDTITIVVLSPPTTPNDTSICFYGDPIILTATPAGGKWFGRGIVNQQTGMFNPRIAWGTNKVWYQIGSCADTVIVTVTRPYNYENVFCPGNIAYPVYWFGPAGGTWDGPKITPSGMFLPDTPGVYKVNYTWKGCTSEKEIRVENVNVPEFDTTCESTLRDTLFFQPKGLIIRYFKGLLNSYWGWFSPTNMGLPGDYNVIFQARGSCRDTTIVTVLPCYAGPDQTICPSEAPFQLQGYRKTADAIWSGKGIIDSESGYYDPSWCKGKNATDTVYLTSKHCSDFKIINLNNTDILTDTLQICPNAPNFDLSEINVNVYGGNWSGPEIYTNGFFNSNKLIPGIYKLYYTQNSCTDSIALHVFDYVQLPSDTLICSNLDDFELHPRENGFFWGESVYLDSNFYFIQVKGQNADSLNVFFTNSNQCDSNFMIYFKDPVIIDLENAETTYCFKDTLFIPNINPIGGEFYYMDTSYSFINPTKLGSGIHRIVYSYEDDVCKSIDSWSLLIHDPIETTISPFADSICLGDVSTLFANAIGGIGNYVFTWSHNQTGAKTNFAPTKTKSLQLLVSDGCSKSDTAEVEIFVHPSVWFTAVVSDSVCYGMDGFIELKLRNGDPAEMVWSYPGRTLNGRYFAPSGNDYKVFVTDKSTGCFNDTSIHIPGFQAVKANLQISAPAQGNCYTPLDTVILIRNNSVGINSGNLMLNSSDISDFNIGSVYSINTDLLSEQNRIKLFVTNDAGCTDSIEIDVCFKDTVIIYMPNAFTPDENGLNDNWKWDLFGANEVELRIFNRWGECVFQSNQSSGRWNGQYLGNPLPEGLYVLSVIYKSKKTAKRKYGQTILLMRNGK